MSFIISSFMACSRTFHFMTLTLKKRFNVQYMDNLTTQSLTSTLYCSEIKQYLTLKEEYTLTELDMINKLIPRFCIKIEQKVLARAHFPSIHLVSTKGRVPSDSP